MLNVTACDPSGQLGLATPGDPSWLAGPDGGGIAARSASAADAAVIEQSRAEPDLVAVIFDLHADEIYGYAARRLRTQGAADVLSDVFLAAFRNRLRYQVDRAHARRPCPG